MAADVTSHEPRVHSFQSNGTNGHKLSTEVAEAQKTPTHVIADLHPSQTTAEIVTAELPGISGIQFPDSEEAIADIINRKLAELNRILESRKFDGLREVFGSTSYWRDHLGVSMSDFNAVIGVDGMIAYLSQTGQECTIGNFEIMKGHPPKLTNLNPKGTHKCLGAYVTWENLLGKGRGMVTLIPDVVNNDEWRIFNLFTTLSELKDYPERNGDTRSFHPVPESVPNTVNWSEYIKEKREFTHEDPAVLIVGAGHSGLMTAARLSMLGVSTLIVDKQERSGDSWRTRYYDLVLHDTCWMNVMPYLKYPTNWPVLAPKDKVADFLEMYEELLELNVWNQTRILNTDWDAKKKLWTVELERLKNGKFERRIFHPRHLVQATGLNGEPRIPKINGMEDFRGSVMHASEFPGAPARCDGKKVVVVGAGTSGHDVAAAYHSRGADVTMVQRGPVMVGALKTLHSVVAAQWGEHMDPDDGDVAAMSRPTTLFCRVGKEAASMMNAKDKDLLDSLRSVGFSLAENSPLTLSIMRAGGFYIDTGASKLIASGEIKLKSSPTGISHLTANSMVFPDGETIEAEEIVFATGYSNGRLRTRKVFGDEVADKIDNIWGYDEKGEISGVWRRSGHDRFWVAAGPFWLSRYYSRLLALQIKASEVGLNEF